LIYLSDHNKSKRHCQYKFRCRDNGELDGEVNRIKGIDKNYPNLIMVSIPVNNLEGVVFTKKIFPVKGWKSLTPYTIAVRRGTKFAEKGTKGMNRILLVKNKQLFIMIDKGKADVSVTSRLEGLEEIKKLNIKGIKVLEPPLVKMSLYHYLNKKHYSLVPKITESLQKLEKQGIIQKIRNQIISDMLK
jgi:polar amino acid transport system substrate-binding protein